MHCLNATLASPLDRLDQPRSLNYQACLLPSCLCPKVQQHSNLHALSGASEKAVMGVWHGRGAHDCIATRLFSTTPVSVLHAPFHPLNMLAQPTLYNIRHTVSYLYKGIVLTNQLVSSRVTQDRCRECLLLPVHPKRSRHLVTFLSQAASKHRWAVQFDSTRARLIHPRHVVKVGLTSKQ